jgi:hypothetical protein
MRWRRHAVLRPLQGRFRVAQDGVLVWNGLSVSLALQHDSLRRGAHIT